VRALTEEKFVEYRMSERAGMRRSRLRRALTAALVHHRPADAIGRLRNGRVERLPTSSRNNEPLGLAVAADGSAWYTDLAARAIARVSSVARCARFVLDTADRSPRTAGDRARWRPPGSPTRPAMA